MSQAAAGGPEAVIDFAARRNTQTPCLAMDFGFMQPKSTPSDINYGCMRISPEWTTGKWWAGIPSKVRLTD